MVPSPQSIVYVPVAGMVMDSLAEVVSQTVTNASPGRGVGVALVISIIWTPSSMVAATATYVVPPDSNVAMPRAPLSLRLALSPMLPAATGLAGSVMSIIWTPSSMYPATAAYVVPPDSNMAMLLAPLSSRSEASPMLPAATGLAGSVMLIIWTPSSEYPATAAYVVPPDSKVIILWAPASLRLALSPMLPAATGLAGSVMLIIWTPSSMYEVTAAYVVPPDSNVVMPLAPKSL